MYLLKGSRIFYSNSCSQTPRMVILFGAESLPYIFVVRLKDNYVFVSVHL